MSTPSSPGSHIPSSRQGHDEEAVEVVTTQNPPIPGAGESDQRGNEGVIENGTAGVTADAEVASGQPDNADKCSRSEEVNQDEHRREPGFGQAESVSTPGAKDIDVDSDVDGEQEQEESHSVDGDDLKGGDPADHTESPDSKVAGGVQTPKAPAIEAAVTTSSFTRSISGSGSGLERSSSPSTAHASGPKKFSAVSINKKFLSKTGKEKEPVSPSASSTFSAKPSSLGLIRPSASATPGQTLGGLSLRTGKLSGTLAPKPAPHTSATGGSSTVWAKPAVIPDQNQVGLGMADVARRKGLTNSRQTPSMGSGQGLGDGRQKKTWGQLMSEGGGSSGAVGRNGQSMEFPTAKEVVDGQRSAILQAQQVAQARAAHNQAILEGLDAFRGTNRDPNLHYWDEEDDDISFDQVVDFGDGTTYTIEAPKTLGVPGILPDAASSIPGLMPAEPSVTKGDRFASDDFDRSWPPKAGPLPPATRPEQVRSTSPPRRIVASGDLNTQSQAARVLFNERSNRLENPAATPTENTSTIHPQVLAKPQMPGRQPSTGVGAPNRVSSAVSGFERALPPHLAGLSGDRLGSAADVGRHPVNENNVAGQSAHPRPATGSDWRDRPLPPHLAAMAPKAGSPMNNAILPSSSGRLRRPSDAGHIHPISRDPPPHVTNTAEANLLRPPSNVQSLAAAPSLSSQVSQQVKPEIGVDLDEMQKGEMHSAAERARLRRQQEEEERAAKAERARQKAKQLEDRIRAAGIEKAPFKTFPEIPNPQIVADVQFAHRISPEVAKVSPVLLRRPSAPQTATASAIAPQLLVPSRRIEAAQIGAGLARPLPPHMQPARTVTAALGQQESSANSPSASAPPPSKGLSARVAQAVPASMRAQTGNANIWTAVDGNLNGEATSAGIAAKANMRPAVLGSSNWRKSSVGAMPLSQPPQSGHTAADASQDTSMTLSAQASPSASTVRAQPAVSAQKTLSALSPSVEVPPVQVDDNEQVSSALMQPPQALIRNGPSLPSNSSLEDLMAKIRFAMTAPSEVIAEPAPQHRSLKYLAEEPMGHASPVARDPVVRGSIGSGSALDTEPVVPPPAVEAMSSREKAGSAGNPPLARPDDFVRTQQDLPASPKAAWKTYTARVPKGGPVKSKSRSWGTSHPEVRPPQGWTMSWDPPLDHHIPATMARDDWLIGRSYLKGKIVYNVRLPTSRSITGSKAKGKRPMVDTSASPAVTTATGRKIVVKLPPARKQIVAQAGPTNLPMALPHTATSDAKEDFAQTTVDVQTSSPISSHTSPRLGQMPSPLPASAILRQRSPRKQQDGHGVTFAQGRAMQATETAEQKGSVRFMVSSELEGDNLLQEVNKMSLEGLGEGVVEELEISREAPTQPKTPTSPSVRSSGAAKSGPPSPNAATSAAWNTAGTYAGIASPARGLPNREHIKNVWSHSAGDALQQGNSLIGIADDFPSMLVNSVQDLRDVAVKSPSLPVNVHSESSALEDDSPRYASISMSSQTDHAAPISTHGPGGPMAIGMQSSSSGHSMYSANGHNQQRAYLGNHGNAVGVGGLSMNLQDNIPNDIAHGNYGPLPIGAISNSSAFSGYAGAQPQGVWMPLNQGSAMTYPGQGAGQHADPGSYAYNAARGQRMTSPPTTQQMPLNGYAQPLDYVQAQNSVAFGGQQRVEYPYMGTYSHAGGPVDSQAVPYGGPRPFVGGSTFPAAGGSSFGPVIGQRYMGHQHSASGSVGQTSGGARARMATQGGEQSRYGPALLANEKPNNGDGYPYRAVGVLAPLAQTNLAANAVRQGHIRGGSGGSMRRGPW